MTERARRNRKGGGRGCAVAFALLAAVAVAAAGATWFALYRSATSVEPGSPVQIEVKPGSSTAAIAESLARAGVVPNALMFRLRARMADADGDLKPGVYDLATGMPHQLVIDRMTAGPPVAYVSVTIPEGFVVEQIAARFEEQAGIPSGEFLKLAKTGAGDFDHGFLAGAGGSLEGYLFPKTYRVKEGATASDVIGMMLDQFDKETAGLDTSFASSRGLDFHQLVTLASMIEREASVGSERPLVSSVIYNRLGRGMRLEIDATIEYVLPGNRFRLRNRDLKIDSPYNTYMHKGLPPGPICSPGLAALQAAASPAETGYLYYVLTGKDGSHTFTRTFEEFLVAKRKSKEVFGR